jgi:surface protein
VNGYNNAFDLQNYVYFTKGTGFHDITITNGWDVSKVTNMANMFRNTSAFNQPIGSWNVSSVDRMDYMFNSSAFNQPLGNNFGFESDLPANFGTFIVVGADFPNQNIDQWAYDTSDNTIIIARNISDNSHTRFCKIDLDGNYIEGTAKNKDWDNSIMNNQTEVIDRYNSASSHGDYHQFTAGSGFDDITFSNGWDVSSVTTFNNMFHSNASFNQNISKWNVSSATNIEHMFRYAYAFNQDISEWDVSNVTIGFYAANYGHGSGHSVSIFRGIINNFRDDSHDGSGSLYEFTSGDDLFMTSTMSSADASGDGWSDQKMHFQTKLNNYSRVDFIFSKNSDFPRFSVGLTKEDFGSIDKSLLTAGDYYEDMGEVPTYFQIHNNAEDTFVGIAPPPASVWTSVGNKNYSNTLEDGPETICSIICSDYWKVKPFGTDPTNIGRININNVGAGGPVNSWGLDEDGYIILELRGETFGNGFNFYIKIDKQGNMKEDSSYYTAAGSAGTVNAPTSLSDLISRYYSAGNPYGVQTYSFDKATDFLMPKIIQYVINGTVAYETPTDYTGKFYIAALINGPGKIEFLPNSATYFNCFYHEASYGNVVGGYAGISNVVDWLGAGSDTAKINVHNGSMIGYGSSVGYWSIDVTSDDNWMGFELNQSETITSYRIWPLAGYRNESDGTFFREQSAPRDWTIQGSNDGGSWTVIDTQTGETFTVGLTDSEAQSSFGDDVLLDAETDGIQYSNTYNIAYPGSYKYYKIIITDTSNRNYDKNAHLTEMAYYI